MRRFAVPVLSVLGVLAPVAFVPGAIGQPASPQPHEPTPAPQRPAPAPQQPALPEAPPDAALIAHDVSALLEPIRAKHDVPALAACLVSGETVTMIGASGVREANGNDPATVDDLWHIGSCAKAITATLCAVLVEEGRLTWGSTPADVFPELAPDMHESWRKVTLRHLVTHRGGVVANATGALGTRLARSNEPPHVQRRLLVEALTQAPTASPPGTSHEYSNVGYAIAGAMCERAAGEPYESLVRRRVLSPLGADRVGFGAPGLRGVVSQPRGHTGPRTPVQPGHGADNPPWIAPAGGLHMPLRDWARFIALHLRGNAQNPSRAERLISRESFDLLHTPDAGEYAGGWGRGSRPWAGGVVLTHAGSNTMWFCVVWVAPKRDFAVLACTNIGGDAGAKAADEAVGALIQRHLASNADAARDAGGK
ncbi:MAG: serine hydrolase domain-containing protein [Planctomycetota bacterium]|nr:serine hydrolase domain-containing protein [Planctomycetota bacterium]